MLTLGGSSARPRGVSLNLSEECSASYRGQLSIGGLSVKVVGCRSSDVAFDAEHGPFRVKMNDGDIEIRVSWVPDISRMPGGEVFDSGTTWRLYEHERGFRFDFGNPVSEGQPNKRLIVDQRFRHATLEMSQQYFTLYPQVADPLGYPLDELLITHRLTQEKAIELHGCGIVTADGVGNLFIGHSGAGKSTTTRLWTAGQDVEILSDDRIIVRWDEGRPAVETPVRSISDAGSAGVLRLRDRSASRASRFAQDDRAISTPRDDKTRGHMRMYGTPWHGEAMFASPNSAPLTRIMVLEHGYGNVLTRLSPSQAVAELFARSFVPMHRHEYVESALAFLEQLAGSVPCYRYSFEPDQRAVDTILNLHD